MINCEGLLWERSLLTCKFPSTDNLAPVVFAPNLTVSPEFFSLTELATFSQPPLAEPAEKLIFDPLPFSKPDASKVPEAFTEAASTLSTIKGLSNT